MATPHENALHAAEFYRRLGFREFMSRPLTLFLPIATALRAMEAE